ncbi:outer membrane protein [Enterovibrio baiacu]|uniref:outer membrane protein n=1 Tax=Enterovibrio baiacu TaxID=2491023 RepID=UPI00101050A7|nr:outer membrane beta-barrel protein [Enterovibrio baiacu]MBE1275229.1 porin family protein [Enterovibrio baiacu]
MNLTRTPLYVAAFATTFLSGLASAEGFYITGLVGKSYQATDSEPYGNNIAQDADFPGKFDAGDGTVSTLGLGYVINEQFRIETRLGYREGKFNSQRIGTGARTGEEYVLNGKLKSTTLTVEGFYDVDTGTAFTPYIKAGVGVARNEYSARLGGAGVQGFFDQLDGAVDGYYDDYADETSTEFTWNLGVGASYAITDQLSLIGEYQYISLGDAGTGVDSLDFGSGETNDGFRIDEATAHEVQLGLRYHF